MDEGMRHNIKKIGLAGAGGLKSRNEIRVARVGTLAGRGGTTRIVSRQFLWYGKGKFHAFVNYIHRVR